ncbi:hypothetical protein Pse7367_0083 [Thalassoporum mexicanum PCC 7367]|uniref:hypothetical protein n=1 Tax=Thalassoporum mexicanum TaxID=3457544 RepID=UPI00029F8A1C|nr:hypothetical protein [Pseudanabaena sp. PCC 7367]AFY68401.1 hypothetical protein Pse7367_0083 [Pseudanabaena sp. PCC 7367]
MRILFTIPHYFAPTREGKYGSQRQSQEAARIQAIANCIGNLQQLFGQAQYVTSYYELVVLPANGSQDIEIDIVVCTTGDQHVLDRLPIPSQLYEHHSTHAEPMLLGFECHQVLSDRLGQYDYYCYLEDDLILSDALLFTKLNWFCAQTSNEHLLQPNRYEVCLNQEITGNPLQKTYVDCDIHPNFSSNYQDPLDRPLIQARIMGQPLNFYRPFNPHSGCFFLNQVQMQTWVKQPYFLDRDTSFFSPLESAASLGIMKTFKIYKPAPRNANFLELQHFGDAQTKAVLSTIERAKAAAAAETFDSITAGDRFD